MKHAEMGISSKERILGRISWWRLLELGVSPFSDKLILGLCAGTQVLVEALMDFMMSSNMINPDNPRMFWVFSSFPKTLPALTGSFWMSWDRSLSWHIQYTMWGRQHRPLPSGNQTWRAGSFDGDIIYKWPLKMVIFHKNSGFPIKNGHYKHL